MLEFLSIQAFGETKFCTFRQVLLGEQIINEGQLPPENIYSENQILICRCLKKGLLDRFFFFSSYSWSNLGWIYQVDNQRPFCPLPT